MKEQNITDYWDFIMENLPFYTSDDRVLYSDILYRYLNDEEVSIEDESRIKANFNSRKEIIDELKRIDGILLNEALEAHFKRKY